MDADARPHQAINKALERLLRPLFRLLLRNGISYVAFEELTRRTFVDVSIRDFGIPGRKPSISRASVLSGLSRKEILRLLSDPPAEPSADGDPHNRAARVLTGWVRDAEFLDAGGVPRPLDPEGAGSFAALVKRYSGDMPARAVLDELMRVGAVERLEGGRLELVEHAYVPRESTVEKLRILGADVADLIDTIDHNVQHGATDPRFQRKVLYQSMPADALPAFRKLSAAQSQALLEKLDRWLAAHDTDNPPDDPNLPRARVGLGIYYFEQWIS
jgi:Family of unknown function (DUF6502)